MFPYIKKACKEIAYDNGMINRFYSEEEIMIIMLEDVFSAFTADQVAVVEDELSKLTEEEFEQAWSVGDNLSPLTNSLLDVAFNGT